MNMKLDIYAMHLQQAQDNILHLLPTQILQFAHS